VAIQEEFDPVEIMWMMRGLTVDSVSAKKNARGDCA